jgi:hypothetical protein
MSESNPKFATLKPLIKSGDYKPEPQDCKCAFADSKCIKRVDNKTCPTNCLETGICGGWQPRDKGLPLLSRLKKKKT